MTISQAIQNLGETGPRSNHLFETLVTNVLKTHVEQQKKPFQTEFQHPLAADAFTPEGFDQFAGPTLIKAHFNLTKLPLSLTTNRILKMVQVMNKEQKLDQVLMVSSKKIPDPFKQKFHDSIDKQQLPCKVLLWGPDDLQKVANKHKAEVKVITEKLFPLRLEAVKKPPEKDWKTDRAQRIEQLKTDFNQGNFTLVLGQQVAASAAVPDREALLNTLHVHYLQQQHDKEKVITADNQALLIEKLGAVNEPSARMVSNYLRQGMHQNHQEQDQKAYFETLTKAIYGEPEAAAKAPEKDGEKPAKAAKKPQLKPSPLIENIATLCLSKRTGTPVDAVISYNYDDLLEKQLSQHHIAHASLYHGQQAFDPDELPVYHINGFLPEQRDGYEDLDQAALLFCDESQLQRFSDPYHWSNLIQLNNLRDKHCLIIGQDLSDANLRKLLEVSARNTENPQHYTFMPRLSADAFGKARGKAKEGDTETQFLLEWHHTLTEAFMSELGVCVIWVEDEKEVAGVLGQIQ